MDTISWQKQTTDKPLFEDIIWSRPVNKKHQGKLFILGGNLHSINAPSSAFNESIGQKVGTVSVLMPDKTARYFKAVKVPEIEFAPSSISGSFGQEAYELVKAHALTTDATLLAGDFGKNSETYILLENFADLPSKQIYCHDSLDCFIKTPLTLLDRQDTLLVIDFARLQKYISASGFNKALTSDIELVQMVELLQNFSKLHRCSILTRHRGFYFVAFGGKVVSSKDDKEYSWPIIASGASVWWLQHPNKPLEAIATSLIYIDKL